MKAITIKEPWASMISHGYKTMETRSWATKYRGRIAIHAGKGRKCGGYVDEMMKILNGDIHPGCVIAYADLVDCVPITKYMISKLNRTEFISGFYSEGRYAFVLENVTPVEPYEAKGQLGIWNLKEEER